MHHMDTREFFDRQESTCFCHHYRSVLPLGECTCTYISICVMVHHMDTRVTVATFLAGHHEAHIKSRRVCVHKKLC